MTIKYDGLTKEELLDLPVLTDNEFDNLVREDMEVSGDMLSHVRVWVSKLEITPDGTPQITIESYVDGEWEVNEIF